MNTTTEVAHQLRSTYVVRIENVGWLSGTGIKPDDTAATVWTNRDDADIAAADLADRYRRHGQAELAAGVKVCTHTTMIERDPQPAARKA